MRPVNLIPLEERRGAGAPARAGSLSYILVGTLAVLLLGAVLLVTTANKTSAREAEVTNLQQELTETTQHTESLQSFASFAAMEQLRRATVTSLANSRFDWERVMRELALIIPKDVWLANVTGTASADVNVDKGAEISARDDVAGPALEIVGCGVSQDAVARFIAALGDIDGVTRVGVASSSKSETATPSAGTSSGGSTPTDCRTRTFIARFEVVVAFDAVPEPQPIELPPAAPSPAGATQPEAAGVAAAGQQVDNATNIVPGG